MCSKLAASPIYSNDSNPSVETRLGNQALPSIHFKELRPCADVKLEK